MKNILIVLILFSSKLFSQQLDVTEKILKNGLKIILVENHTVPNVCLSVGYHVGSRNERFGITGISHLFEHMMFNGSSKYKPTEFDKILESGGGYSNAFTSNDITFYYEEFNSDLLEKVFDLESDRIRSLKLDDANVEQERGIVKEERRLRTDNSPQGKMWEDLYAAAFVGHPYHNPVVGWMKDLDNISLDDCKDYFRIYYAPNNATLTLVGDFKTEKALPLIEKYFADIPPAEKPRNVNDAEPAQEGEKRIELKKTAQLPAVLIGYKAPKVNTEDFYILNLLSSILSRGESSRLYSNLVYEKQIATSVYTDQDDFIDGGLFIIYAQATPGSEISNIENEIHKTIDSIKVNGITSRELQKAKNGMLVSNYNKMKTNNGVAMALGVTDVIYGNYKNIFTAVDKYNSVTEEQIKKVAEKYFLKDKRTVVTLIPLAQ